MRANAYLIGGLIAHLALTGAPGVAAALYAVRRGVRNVPIILGVALAVSGVCAYAAFGAYYADPAIGIVWDFLLLFGSVGLVVWCWRSDNLERPLLNKLATPLLLWIAGACFITFLGFLHGGTNQAISMSALRFSAQLPSDNNIPRFFSEWFATHGHTGPPEYPGEWLMSDRPPLQVGYVLSQHAFFNTASDLHYEILCIVVQQLWVVGMWAVLTAARLRTRTRALTMLAAMISDVAILHGFFVWPKLIAAAFLLAALALVISPGWRRYRYDIRIAGLIAALLALSMLSHGSSIFGVIPLALLAIYRGLPSWRWLGVGLVVGVALYAPWTAYQHYADPPGNRLLKWQLGGDMGVDSRGTLEAIEDGYKKAGLNGTIDNKEENFGEMVGWPRAKNDFDSAVEDVEAGRFGLALEAIRDARFYSLLPFLGIFLIAPFAMVAARWRRRPLQREESEWRFALLSFAFFAIAGISWGLLLFGTPDSRTTIHVGSLAVPLLAVCGCVVGLRSVFPRLAAGVVAVNVIAVLIMYTPSLEPPPGTIYSPITAVLAVASLAALVCVLFRPPLRWRGWRPLGPVVTRTR